jgi:hypothetical protein
MLTLAPINLSAPNIAVRETQKLLIQSYKSKCFILINGDTFKNSLPENTILSRTYLVIVF